ncbi:hypothetical protein, partial [Klebsiella pneumoniae]|uniref:hypothetical protein n=1 Tax=Klebsiella pneumoniae TaxID=573 RepID=UPI003F4F38B3
NYMMIVNIIAKITTVEAVFMLPALLISLFLGERASAAGFTFAIVIMLVISVPVLAKKNIKPDFHAREGLVTVGLSWIVVSAFGALPFV